MSLLFHICPTYLYAGPQSTCEGGYVDLASFAA